MVSLSTGQAAALTAVVTGQKDRNAPFCIDLQSLHARIAERTYGHQTVNGPVIPTETGEQLGALSLRVFLTVSNFDFFDVIIPQFLNAATKAFPHVGIEETALAVRDRKGPHNPKRAALQSSGSGVGLIFTTHTDIQNFLLQCGTDAFFSIKSAVNGSGRDSGFCRDILNCYTLSHV